MGEIIPPCLTPLPTRKSAEVQLPHGTHIFWCVYQKSSNLIINNGTCFLINKSLPFEVVLEIGTAKYIWNWLQWLPINNVIVRTFTFTACPLTL